MRCTPHQDFPSSLALYTPEDVRLIEAQLLTNVLRPYKLTEQDIEATESHEFFCDLFALYTLGPAFAWSHLHLSATRGEDPFKVPTMNGGSTTHPADGARMAVLLHGLTLTGFAKEAAEVEDWWNELIAASRSNPDPDYRRCFPKHILEAVAEKALAGVKGMNCRVVDPSTDDIVHNILNGAWREFWRDPSGYADWEKGAVENLRQECMRIVS